MKVVKLKYFPIKGFVAINMFSILFVRKEFYPLEERTMNHEQIHSEQMREMFYLGFYIWYIVEWLLRLLQYYNFKEAYNNISLEKEAYTKEKELTYLSSRRRFSFINYI